MMRVWLATALLGLGAGGCYMKPATTNSPLQSAEGVRLRLVGQDCEDHVGGQGDPISRDLGVKLELDNATGEPLDFSPYAVELMVDQYSIRQAREGESYRIVPGESRTFKLDFLHHSVCDREFALRFGDALRLGGRPVQMAALQFKPY
jgi:hypothetical protein